MKKIIMSMLVCLVLVGCTNTKEVITEYTVKAEDVMPEVNEIDFTSIKDKGNVIYPQRVVDDQMYFRLFNAHCYSCGTNGDYVDFYMYNLSTQGFTVSERTLNNQKGIPFNNGILVFNATVNDSTPLDYSLMFYSKEGVKEIFSATQTHDIYRVFVSEQFIYVGQAHYAEFYGPIISEKVIKYDKEGKLVEEIEIPLMTLEYNSINQNKWYIENDEVKTFEMPNDCRLSYSNLNYQHDSNKLILLQCSYPNPLSAFDTTSQSFISLLPETMTDVIADQVIRIDDDHLFISNVPKGDGVTYIDRSAYDPSSLSFGIYRISDNQYIPIKDETLTLGRFFSQYSNQVTSHEILDYGLAYNKEVGIMKLELDGSILNATTFPIDTNNNYISYAYYEDNHLFLTIITGDGFDFATKLIYIELEK